LGFIPELLIFGSAAMIIVVANLPYLLLHLRQFFFFQPIIYVKEIRDEQVLIELNDWHNRFSCKIPAHHHYIDFGTVRYREYFQKVCVSTMKIGGKENLRFRQAEPSSNVPSEPKLN